MRDEKCVPLAKEFLKVLVDCDGKMGSTGDIENIQSTWEKAAKEMLGKYLKTNLTIEETNYVFKCMIQALELTQNLICDSLLDSLKKLQQKVFDVPRLDEIPLKKVDEIIRG